ncbi:class I SAM-dependent methyltransferase [Mangrovimicrobium sediminis]|uniref:Class I SAM-dependent methyltransferase n=1 Tax=Mangrovimicrobium sediminis TaxID=2562682 RepID=A0A4Z0M9N5_9GAMM|nr:methyltransferase domain-containing protein [Haliea sp. SAOS-164]TGD76241.1 class I SAM-dependent methyltransferase [Haliea sp. SAOS-164]
MSTIYDSMGVNYSVRRCTDPQIFLQLYAELEGATRIVNIGAGTGSYEPADIPLVAVEPSQEMISQRHPSAHPVEQAFAESLPFENESFSHAMTILSMHHWHDRAAAYREINRVATEKFVAITWDPNAEPFWLTRDYFPEMYALDRRNFPGLEELRACFDDVESAPLLIPAQCEDGFLAAFWRRPKAYLSSQVRQSISSFSKLHPAPDGLRRLAADLASGAWAEKNRSILEEPYLDVGYRIITAKTTTR